MKVVLNRNWGGFSLGKQFVEHYGLEDEYDFDKLSRRDPSLVDWVEKYPEDNPDLKVIEIPDDVTDWQIHDYDGMESIIAVIDGKIHWF